MPTPIINPLLREIDRALIAAKYESERKDQMKVTREIHRAAKAITEMTFNRLGEDRVDCINRKYLAPDIELIAKDEITELFNRIK